MSRSPLRRAARLLTAKLPATMVASIRQADPGVRERARAEELLRSDPAAAQAIYRRLADQQPEHPMHWIGLGLSAAACGDLEAAEQAAVEGRRRVRSRDQGHLPLADLEQNLGNTAEALQLVLKGLDRVEQEAPSALIRAKAADYARRLGDDATLIQILEPLLMSGSVGSDSWSQFLHAEMRLNGEASARQVARRYARQLDDAMPLAGLLEVYAGLGRPREARLINRYLVRVWPHSVAHSRRYAFELARDGRGEQADRLLRAIFAEAPSTQAELDFCERAYASGDFAEAARRYQWLSRRRPDDIGAYIAWGYAMANVKGIDAAEAHFGLAAASVGNYSALVALAHMAMRRRDRPLTGERWRVVNRAFPDDSTSVTEQARAKFDSGRPEEALAICEAWRAHKPPNRAIDEFHAWLLANVGRFEEALASVERLYLAGPSWTVAEIMVQSSGLLGRLDEKLGAIVKALPRVASDQDLRHLYAILRLFEYFDRSAAAFGALLPRLGGAVRLDWARPYLMAHRQQLEGVKLPALLWDKAKSDHAELAAKVSDAVLQSWRRLDRGDVDALLAASAGNRQDVHIVNMFEQASGGSELHALDVGERLGGYAEVSFWAPEFPHPLLHAERGVKPIDPSADSYPKGGVLVFVGVYFSLGPWLRLARPSRVLVLYNTFDAVRLSAFVRTLNEMTGCKVELLFCSDMMQAECGLPGLFEPSPIDLNAFPPRSDWSSGRFVIGRHSRDVPEKHSVADGEVYAAMAARGAHVRLLGATCMREIFPKSAAIELRPAQRGGVRQYLEGLDAFYYRTGTWIEPWGRVVIEAMALGLPSVVHERGGYAEAVQSGVDGFVFRTSEEAVDQLSALQDDVALRERIGRAGRRKVETLLGEDALKRLLAVYLMPPATPARPAVTSGAKRL